MTSKLTSDERLVKILSETQATIMEHNSRCVRGSVEVDARLFESMIMELQERRKAGRDIVHKRNPVLAYADSYRDMAKQGVESVPIWSVITDLERNIAPLYRHAQPAPASEPVGEVIEVGDALLVEWHKNLEEGAKLYATPQAPVIPFGLHPDTQKLVTEFCTALAEKLYKAQLKYGYDADWKNDGWPSQCQAHFHQHIAKGDPRDVAAYCAFMWYHGWKTEAAHPAPVVTFYRDGIEAAANYLDQQREAYDSEHGWSDPDTGAFEFGNDAQREYSSTLEELAEGIRGLHPNVGNSPVIPDGYNLRLVPMEHTEAFHAACTAAFNEFERGTGPCGVFMAGHRAMLAAAPQEVK